MKSADGNGEDPSEVHTVKPKEDPGIPLTTVFLKFASTNHKIMFVIGFIAAFASGTSMPLFSIMFRDILDNSNDPNNIVAGVRRAAIFGICSGVALFFTCWIYTAIFMYLGEVIMMKMRVAVFQSMLRQELGWYESHKPGAMSVFLTSDMLKIKESMGEKFGQVIFNLASFLFGLAYGLYQCWSLTLVMLGITPVLAICGAVVMKVVQNLDASGDAAYNKAGGIATEVLSAVRTVFVFNAQEYEVKRFEGELEGARKAMTKKGWAEGAAMGATYFLAFSSYAVAFGYASYVIRRGWNTPGETVGAFFAVLVGAFQLGNAMPYFGTVGGARRVAKQCMEYIERKPEIDVDAGGATPPISGNIEFVNVGFRYPSRPKQSIFEGLNLRVPAGKKVAFVGGSGGGKSSIIGLMQRMYDPENGSVMIDGVDLRQINLKYFRDNVGVVAQEPVLFKGTILENIKLSKPDASDFEVEEVARMANIHDTIMGLPAKYNTDVGDSGSQLSGGQRQRICIARALLKNPKILLLDEATSALDRGSEMEVQKALDRAMGGRSVATIAHRLVTIANSDVINFVLPPQLSEEEADDEPIIMDRVDSHMFPYATICESGSHDELMRKRGQYYQMVAAQSAVEGEGREGQSDVQSSLMKMSFDRKDDAPLVDAAALEKEEQYDDKEYRVPFTRIMQYSKPEMGAVVVGILACILAACIWPAYGLLFTEVVAVFYKPADQMKREIIKWCLLFVALGAATAIGWIFKQGMFTYSGAHLTKRVRVMLFRAILRQDMTFFDMKKYDSGALAAVLSGDTAKVYLLFGPSLALQLQNFLTLAIALVIAFYFSWKLALVTLTGLPLMIISQIINWRMMEGFSAKGGGIYSEANTTVIESISGIKTIMSYNLQKRQVDLFTKQLGNSMRNARKSCIVGGICVGIAQLVMFGMFALAFWYGSRLLDSKELTFDKVLRVVMIILMGGMGIGESSAMSGTISEAKAAAGKVFKIIDRKPRVDYDESIKTGKVLPSYKQDIEFSRVSFRYPSRPEQQILSGLKLRVPAGKQIALIGSTGCGKSTVIQLLERFYDPEAGVVSIGGIPLPELNMYQWREHVGLVSQEPVLFDATVEENIRYSKADATFDEIRDAAQIANIHDDIMKLPDQYKTRVGQRGSTMSGGQRQRIAIARAILKKPEILLFDEATAALDNVSEKHVQIALDKIVKVLGSTVITIAHRLTSIKSVDYIAVLHSGVVLEAGTHEELYALGGEYRRRYDAYFSK